MGKNQLWVNKQKYVFIKNYFHILLITTSLFVTLFSCANDMNTVNKYIDAETEPDMVGENVELLYSDSARLQMKMATPLVKKFDSAKEQREEFPEGIHVWLYEKTGELKAEITANWAKHDVSTDLWEARSNVVVIDAEGKKLETEQLFWDPQKGEVYSNKYTKMTKDGSYEGSGESFWAKQDFTEYKFSNKSGIGKTVIYVKDDENEADEKE